MGESSSSLVPWRGREGGGVREGGGGGREGGWGRGEREEEGNSIQ